MADTSKRLDRLSSVRLFSECSKKELKILDRLADDIVLSAGEQIVRQGEYGHVSYIVMEGEATASRDGEVIGRVGPGEAIGELAVIEPGPRTATVTADTDMVLLGMNSPEFLTAVEDVPALSRAIMRSLAQRLRAVEENLLD
jgi:CRP-like cAMP-binding protein